MKKGTRKQRKEAFIAAYKEGLRKQGLLDTKLDEVVAKKATGTKVDEKVTVIEAPDVPVKKKRTKKED